MAVTSQQLDGVNKTKNTHVRTKSLQPSLQQDTVSRYIHKHVRLKTECDQNDSRSLQLESSHFYEVLGDSEQSLFALVSDEPASKRQTQKCIGIKPKWRNSRKTQGTTAHGPSSPFIL